MREAASYCTVEAPTLCVIVIIRFVDYIWITELKVHFDTCNYPAGRTSGQSVDAAMSAYPKGYEIKILWHPISELDVLASIREPALFRAGKYLT